MNIDGKRVAILVADGFEPSEYEVPKKALQGAGAKVTTVSIESGYIRGWNHKEWGPSVRVDMVVRGVRSQDFDAIMLPGGLMNPDMLRQNEQAVRFVRDMFEEGKPIAAICHGPWTLINAGIVRDLRMTSYKSIKVDLENAGALWSDEPVVVDQGIVTSRTPKDLSVFCEKMIEEIGEGLHYRESVGSQRSEPPLDLIPHH